MFSICDVLLVNKIDVAPYFNFSLEKCIERVKKLNPNIQVFPISALKGEGIEPWADWLREPGEGLERVSARNKNRDAPVGAPGFFILFRPGTPGRTYLKNRAQSW